MDTQQETYKGFVIKANAKPVETGYVPDATVFRLADSAHKEFDVQPPALVHATAKAALKEAILWGKDLVDGLTEDLAHGKLH